MKQIKINFIDFWPNFCKTDNIIYETLKQKYEVIITNKPDYVFCSVFGKEHLKYKKQVRILILGENIAPDFNLYDYAIGFYNINFQDRYLKYNILLDKSIKKLIACRDCDNIPTKFCCFVYSKNTLNKQRIKIFNKLSEYKKVDSGGCLLNNIGKKIGNKNMDKINFCKQYKFVIACENQQYPEYNTEKLFEAFASNAIPIYWGDPKINDIYNKDAFINCDNFATLDELKDKIIEIDNDDDKYLSIKQKEVFNENYNFEQQEKCLKDFLYNIFDQEYKNAKRIKLEKGYYSYEFYKIYFPISILHDRFLKIKKWIGIIFKK